jgi:hypothetical protein
MQQGKIMVQRNMRRGLRVAVAAGETPAFGNVGEQSFAGPDHMRPRKAFRAGQETHAGGSNSKAL